MKSWDSFDRFESIIHAYMPEMGEGSTMASQIVTAVNKLIYKWYNDGDVFDNTYWLNGWYNDLSNYANWLDHNADDMVSNILRRIAHCIKDGDYEDLLFDLARHTLSESYLAPYADRPKEGSIYDCKGCFKWIDLDEETPLF